MNGEEAILVGLKALEDRVGRMDKRQETMRAELGIVGKTVAGLKIKSGMWGAIGGAIPVIIALLLLVLNGK